MQDVNPDMNEIFKEAADNYPLQTNTADWSAVSQKLHANETSVKSSTFYNERKWIVLFLLLLIPMELINTERLKIQSKQVQTVAKAENKQVESSDVDRAGKMINEAGLDDHVSAEKINKMLSGDDYSSQKENSYIIIQKNKTGEQKELAITSLPKK